MTAERLLEIAGRTASEEQMAAIMSDKATLVSAGAGSGKTTVLSLRFARLVADGRAHADEILTLTFTKKAAAEMYERIYSILSMAAGEDPRMADELMNHFPRARISTMDSFWSEIARTDSMRYGITRDFTSLDGDGIEDMVKDAFEMLQADDSLQPGVMALSELYTTEQILSFLVRIARDETDILTSFSAEENMGSYRAFISLLEDERCSEGMAGHIISTLLSLDAENPGNGQHDEILRSVDMLRSGELDCLPSFSLNRLRKKADKPLSDFIKDEYRPFISSLQALSALRRSTDRAEAVSQLLERFVAAIQRLKRQQGALTFRDTESLCRSILISNHDVREYYRRRFRYIMVDEFQDNNTGQKELLYLLSERDGVFSSGIPTAGDLDPGKLFFVGDDKQSIYYFRGADVSVFRSLADDVASMGGNVLPLSANYRSEPAIIDHVNSVFDAVFSSALDEEGMERERFIQRFTSIPYASFGADPGRMEARAPYAGLVPRIELCMLPKDAPQDGEWASRPDSEALFIADRIARMTESDDYLIPDGNGGLRRPSFSDIAVLLRTAMSQMPIERAFRARSIPYVVSESSSATLEGLAWDIYAFLQLLIYPEDRAAYMAVLRSPLARISDEGLLFIASMEDGEEAFAEEPSFQSEDDSLSYDAIHDLYSSLRSEAGRSSIASILDRLFYESGYHAYLQSSPYLSAYEEHFSYLWASASLFDSKGKGLPSFLSYLRPLIGHPEKLEDATVQHLGAGGVQIMTIHRSKGLQFPIVIIADADHGMGNMRAQDKLISVRGSHPVILPDLTEPGEENALLKEMNDYGRRREEAELRRVLYVAMTRAADHLVLTAQERRIKSGPSLLSIYSEAADIRMAEEIGYAPAHAVFGGEREKGGFDWYSTPLAAEPRYSVRRIGVRDSSHSEAEYQPDHPAIRLPDLPTDRITEKHSIQQDTGSAVHAALEALVSGTEPSFQLPSSLPDPEREELEEAVMDTARSFLSSRFYLEAVKGRRTETEVRFYYPSDGIVLEGSADLLVFYPDHILVVDYKTDRFMDEMRHRAQIAAYASAIGDLYGMECLATLLYVRGWRRGEVIDRDGNPVREP